MDLWCNQHSTEGHAASVVFARKPNGTWQICYHNKGLNLITCQTLCLTEPGDHDCGNSPGSTWSTTRPRRLATGSRPSSSTAVHPRLPLTAQAASSSDSESPALYAQRMRDLELTVRALRGELLAAAQQESTVKLVAGESTRCSR